jgi:hypothetical protein
MTKELLTVLFFFLTLSSCNNIERKNSIEQSEVGTVPTLYEPRSFDKELEYSKTRDRYIDYFKISRDHYDQDILDKQDSDSLLVLEDILRAILKDASIAGISKNGKINLETLQPDMGFGGLDGLVLNKNNVVKNSAEIVVTTKTLFFDYFKGYQINSLDSLTIEQLDNIFTSTFGRGQVHTTTYSILEKSFTKHGQTYGCIGTIGQESGELTPDHTLVLASNESYIYIFLEYLNSSIIELSECKSISDSLNSLSDEYSKLYEESIPKDKSLISKAADFQLAAWEQYCNCYQKNLKDKVVFEKIRNQVIKVMQYAEK